MPGNGYTTGKAMAMRERIRRHLALRGQQGMTIAELREIYPDHHHGTLSGALSNSHRAGEIALLDEKRDGCRVYVDPAFVFNRPTRPHGRNNMEAISA